MIQVMWASVCVTDKDGTDHYVHRGAALPDWVDDFTAFALTSAGAAQHVDDPAPARPAATAVGLPEVEPDTDDGDTDELVKPSADASKADWVTYASDERNPKRMTAADANARSKTVLMDLFKDQ
jgi:hypothetical protein